MALRLGQEEGGLKDGNMPVGGLAEILFLSVRIQKCTIKKQKVEKYHIGVFLQISVRKN